MGLLRDAWDLFFGPNTHPIDRVFGVLVAAALVMALYVGVSSAHRELTNPVVQVGDVVDVRYKGPSTWVQQMPTGNGGFYPIVHNEPERHWLVREAWRKDGTRTTRTELTDSHTFAEWRLRLEGAAQH